MTVDELVFELKLDSKGFTDGQRKALDSFKKTDDEFTKRLKNLESTTKNTGMAFGGMTGAAEGLFTVLAGAGVAAFARDAMNAGAATGRMAINVGVTTRELDAFGKVIERNGGNAQSAQASLKAYADTIQNWKWGKGSPDFLMGISQVGAGLNDDPIEVARKLAKFAETHNAQEVNQTGARLGMSPDIINSIIHGLKRFNEQYAETYKLALDPAQTHKLTEAQSAWIGLGQAIKSVGTDVVSNVEGPFSGIVASISHWIGENRKLADSLGTVLAVLAAIGSVSGLGKLFALIGGSKIAKKIGISGLARAGGALGLASGVGEVAALAYANLPTTANAGEPNIYENGKLTDYGRKITGQGGGGTSSDRDSAAVREARIRSFAKMLGVDPDVAMKVTPAEGFNKYVGDNGTSFGDFQLHVTPGGRGNAVGDQFKKQTGLDPSNSRNEAAMDLFALQDIARNGWHDYHGAARVGVGDRDGIGGGIHIDAINITTNSDNPREHGRLTADAIRNSSLARQIANNANSGQRP